MTNRSKMARASFLIVVVFLSACKEDDTELLRQCKQLAHQFHKAVMVRDDKAMSELVLFPFNFDNQDSADGREAFRKIVKKRFSGMQARMKSARSMEAVTYSAFVDGHPIRGKKLEGDAAIREAAKLGFMEGDVLVRCYAINEDKKQDGRDYYVVVRKDALGDLKIHTYFD